MSRDKVRQEIAEYLNKEPNLFRRDRQAALEQIMDKQFFQRRTPHAINRIDLLQIASNAGNHLARMKMPCHISGTQMESNDCRHIAMIEVVLEYLNSNGLLNKEVSFDYTSSEYVFDPIED